MVMEVKIKSDKLVNIMLANYEEHVPMFSESAEREIRELLGDDFVNAAYTQFKDSVVAGYGNPDGKCNGCSHCHPVKEMCCSGWSLSHGYCDLLRTKVRLSGRCGDTKREGGME